MTFPQRVAAIKREHRKRHPQKLYEELTRLTRLSMDRWLSRSLAEVMEKNPLLVALENNFLAAGVWRDASPDFHPLSDSELAERARQYAALRDLEGGAAA